MRDSIIQQYRNANSKYKHHNTTVIQLINNLMRDADVRVHSINGRVKEESSLEKKISKPEKDYENLSEITDISGIRIITYFAEDVDKIAEIIKAEFLVDDKNSIDKRADLASDRFGYQSLHFVVKLNGARAGLRENQSHSDLPCEIQIRSMLQHAWAEVEHDLGYKAAVAIPSTVKRRFARIAGLLEIADAEFEALRKDIGSYVESMSNEIKTSPGLIEVNRDSLKLAYATHPIFPKIDEKIATIFNASLSEVQSVDYAKNAILIGANSVEELRKFAEDNFDLVVKFAEIWSHRSTRGTKTKMMSRGIGLFYLAYVANGESFQKAKDYVEKAQIKRQGVVEAQALAQEIVAALEKAKSH